MRRGERRAQQGYMLVLALIALASLQPAPGRHGPLGRRDAARARAELLRIGNEIAGALAAYAKDSAGSTRSHRKAWKPCWKIAERWAWSATCAV